MTQLTVRLPNELSERLEHLSLETGRTKSFYVKAAIENYLMSLDATLLNNAKFENKKPREIPVLNKAQTDTFGKLYEVSGKLTEDDFLKRLGIRK